MTIYDRRAFKIDIHERLSRVEASKKKTCKLLKECFDLQGKIQGIQYINLMAVLQIQTAL